MDSYYHNLKVLLGKPYLEGKHLGYFSSLISLYLRATDAPREKKEGVPNTYFGEKGQKFTGIEVELKFVTSFDTAYGTMWLYSFYDTEGHVFVYKGKYLGIDKGDKVKLGGTIKDHQEFKGTKQTVVLRPKIEKIV